MGEGGGVKGGGGGGGCVWKGDRRERMGGIDFMMHIINLEKRARGMGLTVLLLITKFRSW